MISNNTEHRLGSKGCKIYSDDQIIEVPSYSVVEVDPTGAGDTFCGAFLAALIEDKCLLECGIYANAAGAMSVEKLGPMEGAPNRKELEEFIRRF